MPSPIISMHKVRSVICSLKTGEASGTDGPEFADELAAVLCRLFRLILESGTYPSFWMNAFLQPVPEKDDWSYPSNYRPIALTSTILDFT